MEANRQTVVAYDVGATYGEKSANQQIDVNGSTDLQPDETSYCNSVQAESCLTICIPAYRDNPAPLLDALAELDACEHCRVLIYDDGSDQPELTRQLELAVDRFPAPAQLITCSNNRGRSAARNRLTDTASTDWLLLLDADMLPDERDFLSGYLDALRDASEPALITGGYSVRQVAGDPALKLHIAQASRSNCLSAQQRSQQPGRYVFTSNILVHGEILHQVPFDESFDGWGWEDVDWGLRVVQRYPVIHVDHTATHMGLDKAEALLDKYRHSGANFARVVQRHPAAAQRMALLKIINTLHRLPPIRVRAVRKLLRKVSRATALAPLPIKLRLLALKSFRALHYYEYVR